MASSFSQRLNKLRALNVNLGTALSNPMALRGAEIICVIILAILAGRLVWLLVAPLPVIADGENQIVPTRDVAASTVEVKSPFPMAEIAPATIAQQAPDVEETRLNLELTGVFAAESGGSALIKKQGNKEALYAVGDEIDTGVSLHSVYADRVILSRGGVRESLRFESKAEAADRAKRSAGRQTAQPQSTGKPTSLTSVSTGQFSSVFRVAPAQDSAGNTIIHLYSARDRATFNALGLKEGDRLVSINGTPAPTNPSEFQSALSIMQRKRDLTVVVERGGKEIPISLSGLGQ